MGKDSRTNFTELVKDKPPSTYPGKTGSMGKDVPAVATHVIDAQAVLRDEEAKRELALTVEQMDAKSLTMVEQMLATIDEAMMARPPADTKPEHKSQSEFLYAKLRADTAVKMMQIITRRMPQGLYRPTVILEGQRFEIPMDPKEWSLYHGRPHLKYSLQYVLESQSNSGYCIGTKDGECHLLSKSRENAAKMIVVHEKKPEYIDPEA